MRALLRACPGNALVCAAGGHLHDALGARFHLLQALAADRLQRVCWYICLRRIHSILGLQQEQHERRYVGVVQHTFVSGLNCAYVHTCSTTALGRHSMWHERLMVHHRLAYLDLGVEGVDVTVDLHEVHVDQVEALACQRHLLFGKLNQHLLVCLNHGP